MTFNDFPDSIPEDGQCDVVIMGVPTDAGSGQLGGQRSAPGYIRSMDMWDSLYDPMLKIDLSHLSVVDVGDCYVNHGDIEETHANVTAYAEEYGGAAAMFITLGGDHSITPHVIRGLMKHQPEPPVIIHLDAHADVGDHDNYHTNHHGSWVRYALDEALAWEVHTFGVRSLGPDEKWFGKASGATQHAHQTVNSVMDVCWTAALQKKKVYLSVDMDVVDPAFAPGVVFPEPGGWTSRELLNIIASVCSFRNVIGVDIVEVCPPLDVRDLTLRLASRCVMAALRGYYLSRSEPTSTEVEARRGEIRPVPNTEGAAVSEPQAVSPTEGVGDDLEHKSTADYSMDDVDEEGDVVEGEDEDEEGGMGTRATTAVKAAGRGGKKAARGGKKAAKKAGKAAKASKKTAKKATKKTVKKAAKATKAVAPARKTAAKAPAKSTKKAAKKVAKKR